MSSSRVDDSRTSGLLCRASVSNRTLRCQRTVVNDGFGCLYVGTFHGCPPFVTGAGADLHAESRTGLRSKRSGSSDYCSPSREPPPGTGARNHAKVRLPRLWRLAADAEPFDKGTGIG